MPIYERPVKTLMLEFVKAELVPGQVFERSQAVRWFATNYPRIRPGTVQAHVEGMAVNSPLRKHHPNIRPGSGHDVFYKLGPKQFRLWDQLTDGPPFYVGDEKGALAQRAEEADDSEEDEDAVGATEFAFERDLRNYLERNLEALEPGLRLYEEEGFTGVEFPVGGRRIDLLAVDKGGAFVVIELKVSRGYDRVIGQTMRYMAWVKQNLAAERPVRGIIVASEITGDLKLAASLMPDVRLVEYELSFRLRPID